MGNHVLEYVIKLTDKVSVVAESVANGVKKMANTAANAMSRFKRDMDVGPVEEKLIKTKEVLEKFENAFARLVPNGETLSRVMDNLEHDCDGFNKGLIDQTELFKDVASMMEDYGASEKQVAQGMDVLKSKLVEVGKTGASMGDNMGRGFRIAHLAAAVLNGNVYSLTRALSLASKQFKAFQISAGAMTVIGAAIMGCVIVGQKLYEAFKKHREEMERIQQLRLEETLKNISDVQAEVTREIAKSNSALQDEVSHNAEILNQKRDQLKIENELARATELRAAKTEEEKRAINEIHDAYNRELEREKELANLELTHGSNEDRIAKYGVAIAKLQKAADEINGPQSDANRRVRSMEDAYKRNIKDYTGGQVFTSVYGVAMTTPIVKRTEEEKRKEFEDWKLTDENYKKAKEAAERLNEQRKSLNDQIEKLKTDRRRLETQNKELEGKADIEYNRGVLEEYNHFIQAQEKYETDVNEALRKKATERVSILKAELEEQRRVMAAQVSIAEQEHQQALARLAEADRRVAEAWGFYKDRDSLAAHDAAVDGDVAAVDQYAKDYHSLTHGVNSRRFTHLKYLADHRGDDAVEAQLSEWRRKKTISVDSEATMRVALANRELAGAENYAKKTADETQAAHECLEDIRSALTEGGED